MSAAHRSFFAAGQDQGASHKVGCCFRLLSRDDNMPGMPVSSGYRYGDIFWRHFENCGKSGDIALSLSVSGPSPNCEKALENRASAAWSRLIRVGAKRGRMAELAIAFWLSTIRSMAGWRMLG